MGLRGRKTTHQLNFLKHIFKQKILKLVLEKEKFPDIKKKPKMSFFNLRK